MEQLLDFHSGRRLILASASPRRRELLSMLDVEFTVRPLTGVDESYPESLSAVEVPLYLARKKGEAAMASAKPDEIIITADTVVVCNGKVLGKPHNAAEAKSMLRELSGRKHTVVTGVAVSTATGSESDAAYTEVEFAELTEAEIDHYINKYKPFDKAGAYGIQEWIGCIGVKHISGSFYNVMGLPLHLLYNMLQG
ncbi:MAG: Maf family nucleotide pyrophosphatase [Firmicutes bacterium]|nr:Maf family nucleotide pyrophosphatase [Bacillota bacterium]MCM1401369.1 Maf family nucleotide pyrophosphatase [Bacteroides sp.]MCM1477394.1 Maf family nucleotide pyrophosphatase [Bacteroides sp.]